jgi:predicted DNA-binding ribbon-helix-helix protein
MPDSILLDSMLQICYVIVTETETGRIAMSTTIRVSEAAASGLHAIAQARGITVGAVVQELYQEYLDRRMLEETNRAYAALRAEPEAWAAEQALRAELENTLMDGLADDPYDDPRVNERDDRSGE